MQRSDLKSQKRQLPDAPGVYFFKGAGREILYVGKATSLRDRVRSYFTPDLIETRGPRIVKMVDEARSVDFEETDSVLEALVLEAKLIKKYQPPYNTREKDDKSFNYVVITNEDYPAVVVVRGKELHQKFEADEMKYVFGPFPAGGQFKEAMRLIRKIFPFRDVKCTPGQGKPCFNRQIRLCPGVCTEEISKRDYRRLVQHLRLFFEGKKERLIKQLEKEMQEYAKREEFERADEWKRRIFALQHIQDVSLLKRDLREPAGPDTFRIEAYDIAHIRGRETVGVMVVVENGRPNTDAYRKFRIRADTAGSDTDALKEVLDRRLAHTEWPLPRFIVIDGGKGQLNAAKAVLAEAGVSIPAVSVVKDDRHRAREILGEKSLCTKHEHDILLANAEAHRFALNYHRQRMRRRK